MYSHSLFPFILSMHLNPRSLRLCKSCHRLHLCRSLTTSISDLLSLIHGSTSVKTYPAALCRFEIDALRGLGENYGRSKNCSMSLTDRRSSLHIVFARCSCSWPARLCFPLLDAHPDAAWWPVPVSTTATRQAARGPAQPPPSPVPESAPNAPHFVDRS